MCSLEFWPPLVRPMARSRLPLILRRAAVLCAFRRVLSIMWVPPPAPG
jgi:hypothetical protein